MSFDLRPHMTLDPADSQISEGGLAAVENCTWACLADTIYDYDRVRHQTWELRQDDNSLERLGQYAGGESWDRNVTVLAALNPDLAAIAHIETPSDVVGALRAYGEAGYAVHWAGWCTPNAQWTTGDFSGGISHAGRLIAGDDATLTFWNPWTGYVVTAPDDFWRSSYDGGGILVFKQSLGGQMTKDDWAAIFCLMAPLWWGRDIDHSNGDRGMPEDQFWAGEVMNRGSVTAVTEFMAELGKPTIKDLATTQGPKGDKGDAGPKGDTGQQGPKGDAGPAGAAANLDGHPVTLNLTGTLSAR